jgi:hypothetical protein
LTLKHTQPCNVDVFSDRGLTCYLSGEPKASPLEGLVRAPVGNAPSS